jgi:LacI family transcriptional regulator
MITGPMHVLCSRARLDGYRAALERAGLPYDPLLVRRGDYHYPTAYSGVLELMDLADPPTAIFAASDTQAMGAYEALRVRGLRVPDDVSVVGFDDVAPSRWMSPPLTTIHQPLAEMTALAARMILQEIDGKPPDNLHVELATSLVVRESTAPPRTPLTSAR